MSRHVEKLIITRTGQARGLVGPLVGQVARLLGPNRVTRRASHVEPTEELRAVAICQLARQAGQRFFPVIPPDTFQAPQTPDFWHGLHQSLLVGYAGQWWADLLPVQGPVLGPFATNTEALAAEKAWLLAHDIPTAGN